MHFSPRNDLGTVLGVVVGLCLSLIVLLVWSLVVAGRAAVRLVDRGYRVWWKRLAVVLLLAGLLGGCQEMAREVVKLHGVTVNPFPGPCAPASVHTGQCMPMAKGDK